MNRVATSAALFVLTITTSSTTFADHKRDLDELAYDVKVQAAKATREVYFAFRSTPDLRRLYKCSYEMYCLADRIHERVHHGCVPASLSNEVEKLDAMFHDLEDAVDRLKDARPAARFQISRRSSCSIRVGCVNQYHLKRLCRELECLEETIHDLSDLVGFVPKPLPPAQGGVGQPPLPPLPTVPTRRNVTPRQPLHAPGRSTGFPTRRNRVFRHDRNGFSFSIVLSR